MPGTVLVGLGALFMRSVIHWWTAASMHMGSGSGRFITVGMQVNPLVLGLASVSLPSAPYTMTPTSFTRCAGAALSANFTCSCWGKDFTSFTVLGFFPSLAAAIPPQTNVNPRTAPRPNTSSFFMSPSCVRCEFDDLLLLGDNLVLNPLIRGSRKNLLLFQLTLPLIRTALDDLLRVRLANTRGAVSCSVVAAAYLQLKQKSS